jgi:hypothetical protein
MVVRRSCFAALAVMVGLGIAAGDARADAAETLIEQCHIQLDLSDRACDCIGNKAREELTSQQQDLVVAHVTKDDAAAQALQSQMTVEEMTQAGEWMMNAPVVCEDPDNQ